MRVAILTYHNAINYGAVLQAYALSHAINALGYDCEVLDYRCPAVEAQYTAKSFKKSGTIKHFLSHNLTQIMLQEKKKKFQNFVKTHILLSSQYTREELLEQDLPYDLYIVGGDQVFNPNCHRSDATYFLDFVKQGSKNSFSASLGSIEHFERMAFDPLPLLSQFDTIYTREQNAAEYLTEKTGKSCESILDPVWLPERTAWSDLTGNGGCEEDYIFVYNLLDTDTLMKSVKALHKKTGLKVIAASGMVRGEMRFFGWAKSASNCSPCEFLRLLRQAKYVVTDSFHGTAFSMIFGKQFFVVQNDAKSNTNSRITNLLQMAALEDRIVGKSVIDLHVPEIDYSAVHAVMAAERQKALDKLDAMLRIVV